MALFAFKPMAIADQINAFIKRILPQRPTTSSEEIIAGRTRTQEAILSQFATGKTRREIVEECRGMYKDDGRVREIITTIARDAVKGGFTVQVNRSPQSGQARREYEAFAKRIKINKRLEDWTRLGIRDGDSFIELGVDRERNIQLLTRKLTLFIRRNSNNFDLFSDPTRAYWYSERTWDIQPPRDAIWFADWQIVHARWDHDEGDRYGTPMFASGRKAYKRVTEGELDIAVRRKTRAGMRYFHYIETDDENQVDAYRKRNQQALANKAAAIADFFSNTKGGVTAIQCDARLSEIDDVLHHIETLGIIGPLPLELLGYGRNLNRDILEEKREQYYEALPAICEWVTDQLLAPIIERQWLLKGIWPGGLDYQIAWSARRSLTARILQQAAIAGVQLKKLGIPMPMILDLLVKLIPDLNKDEILKAIEDEEEKRRQNQTTTPPIPDETEEDETMDEESLFNHLNIDWPEAQPANGHAIYKRG